MTRYSGSATRVQVNPTTGGVDFNIVVPSSGKRLKIKSILSSNLNFFGGKVIKFRFGAGAYFNEHNLVQSDSFFLDYSKLDLLGAIDEAFICNTSLDTLYAVTVEYEEF